jgi:hypothetical protein
VKHIPSAERILKVFGDSQKAVQLRTLFSDWKNGDLKSREMLEEANGILDGLGIEHLRSQNGKAEAYYVNMGDTYKATILLDIVKDRVIATSWGDYVEYEEAHGNKFE